jgi:preprotein translocase subunit YajC
MLISPAYAQAAGAAPGGSAAFLNAIMPFLLIIPIFYFLLIRPQQRRLKQHREMIAAVKKGDTVVTAGGLIGKVAKVTDDEVEVELAPSTKVRVVKTTLSEVRVAGTGKPANDTAA